MTARWLSVIGIGEDGLEGLGERARTLVDGAEILVGGDRHLAMIPDDVRPRLSWPRPLGAMVPELARHRGRRVCVLATGDPMFYGVGVVLARHFAADEMEIIPSLSAFSLAASRVGWPLADVETLTLHGRPLETVIPFIAPGARLLVLADGAETPAALAALLAGRGYGDSELTVLEHMGGAGERIIRGTAAGWDRDDIRPFNTVAIRCVAGSGAVVLPRIAGLPDDVFASDGNMTGREVRAVTLAALAPAAGERLWDVGAGCGTVAVEWMRSHSACRAVAIERRPERAALITANAMALGVPRLEVVEGEAPAALAALDAPDAVFIGGGVTAPGMLEACWQALRSGGRLVANAVTLESEAALIAFGGRHDGRLGRISVSRAAPVGSFTGWKPFMPVTQLVLTRP